MPKRYVSEDEWYPVYLLSDERIDPEFEFTDEEIADYEQMMSKFREWQKKLRAL